MYTKKEISGMYLQRVDSTLVKEAGNKLKEGMTCGNEYGKSKMLKYTINYDGMFGCFSKVHKEESYASECKALPENVTGHFKKEKGHSSVYLFDRGQNSAEAFKNMKSEEGLLFIGRLNENRKLKHIQSFDIKNVEFTQGELLEDGLYQLYKRVTKVSKTGKEYYPMELVKENFRVIRFGVEGKKEAILLITNILNLSADVIARMYRRRWDIEVFFRFLKQELNFSHFLSLNDNGLQVVLYMTLITAMLVMIYKKENEIGFKTAVRRMGIELESLVMAIVVIQSGGDLKKTELPDP
jgi:transposase